jgi:hypothetical protein
MKSEAIKMALFNALTNMLPKIDEELVREPKQPVIADVPASRPVPKPQPVPAPVIVRIEPPPVAEVDELPPVQPSLAEAPPIRAETLPFAPDFVTPPQQANNMVPYIVMGSVGLVLLVAAVVLGFLIAQSRLRRELAGQIQRMTPAPEAKPVEAPTQVAYVEPLVAPERSNTPARSNTSPLQDK